MSSTRRWFTAILLIGAGLRLLHLGGPSLWYDECFSAWLAKLPLSQLLKATAGDVHPPLYYLILAGWCRIFGYSEVALRFPSVIFGVTSLWLWKRIGEALQLPTKVVLLALAFMAVSPSLLFYSQETRMYSLLIVAASLATLGVIRQSWPLLVIGGTVAMYTHNIAWVYLLALGLLALARGWTLHKLALAVALIGVAYVPWAYHLFTQVQELNGGYWIQPLRLGGIFYSFYPLTFFFGLPSFAAVHGCLITIVLVIIALWKAVSHYKTTYPLLILFILPPAAAAIVSWLWQPIYFYRILLPIVPAMLFLFAYAFLQMRRHNAILLALLVLPLLGLALYRQFGDTRALRQTERENSQVIAENWRTGDCIFHMNVGSAITMGYYLPGKPQFIWAGPAAMFNGALSVETQKTIGLDRREFANLPGTCQRVWLVWAENPLTPPHDEAERLIAQHNGRKFYTFTSNEFIEATLWILEGGNSD